jgi:hypothetical protein
MMSLLHSYGVGGLQGVPLVAEERRSRNDFFLGFPRLRSRSMRLPKRDFILEQNLPALFYQIGLMVELAKS